MDDNEFDSRLDRVRRAAEVIDALPKRLQDQAFQYLVGTSLTVAAPATAAVAATPEAEGPAPNAAIAEESPTTNGSGTTRKTRRGTAKTNKSAPQDRDIDLFPAGKTSFEDFAAEKDPKTNDEKYAVAVYWLLRVAELPAATVPQVVSCYLAANWSLPSQVGNAASRSRQAGFLSSAKAEDLQLTSIGINLVNKVLPRPKS